MKQRSLPVLILASLMLVGAGCGNKAQVSTPQPPESSTATVPCSVKIEIVDSRTRTEASGDPDLPAGSHKIKFYGVMKNPSRECTAYGIDLGVYLRDKNSPDLVQYERFTYVANKTFIRTEDLKRTPMDVDTAQLSPQATAEFEIIIDAYESFFERDASGTMILRNGIEGNVTTSVAPGKK